MPSETPYRSTLRPEDFAPQAGFRVSIVSIIVYLAGVAVHVFMYGGLERLKYGGAITGLVIGGYVAVFLLALLISFFAFAGTRSRIVSALFFCLSVPVLIFADMKVNALADAKILPPVPAKKAAPAAATPAVAEASAPNTAPAASPAAAINGNPTYSASQRQQYIGQANNAFVTLRDGKIKAFTDAFAALQTAGGVSPVGLTSKEAIAERRKLVDTLNLANDDYVAFVTGQEANYRAELSKTPLVPNDVNNTASQFVTANSNTAEKVAVRQTEKDLLKANDDVLAMLDAKWGRWKLRGSQATFEAKADTNQYARLLEKFNTAATAQAAAQSKLTASQGGAAPAATPDAAVAAAADAAATAKGPAAGPTPGASAAPVVTPAGTPASAVKPTP